MRQFGEILEDARKAKKISIKKASEKLLIKKEHLEALEKENWQDLPEASFVKGYINSYSKLLDLDPQKMLAFYRREFDEKKYMSDKIEFTRTRNFFITPKSLRNLVFLAGILIFVSYIFLQYSLVLKSPVLEVFQPPDDITVSVPVVQISGRTEKEATVAIDGEFAPVDSEGNFSYQYNLSEGENVIEIIASKRLSPKSKVTRTVRLST